jgi:hypothetical protein
MCVWVNQTVILEFHELNFIYAVMIVLYHRPRVTIVVSPFFAKKQEQINQFL